MFVLLVVLRHHLRVEPEDVGVELPPGQLRAELLDGLARLPVGRLQGRTDALVDLADADGAELQVRRQPGGGLLGRVVAALLVREDVLLEERLEPLAGRVGARRRDRRRGLLEAQLLDAGHRLVVVGRRQVRHLAGRLLLAVAPLLPEVGVHRVGVAGVGRDRTRLVADGVVELLGHQVGALQRAGDALVPSLCQPRVVVIPRDELGVAGPGEVDEDLGGVAVPDEQLRAALAVPLAQRREGVQHERDAGRSRVLEHLAVEDEHARRGLRRVRKADVVGEPEVPPVPVESHYRYVRPPPGKTPDGSPRMPVGAGPGRRGRPPLRLSGDGPERPVMREQHRRPGCVLHEPLGGVLSADFVRGPTESCGLEFRLHVLVEVG